ncbi:PepSY domain-containing protein [Mesobacterium sp. TK19101]|uniref:PepSY domain-containing protein n=1 Tax=Mesobacterium hydrothermale TaxID=3111907 RepID=A0ABU6HKW0_9RHOB|nr:PepSY domain-containing protein [Mesobacterium sp. TK19101]MEC3861800.1 PepSY domain-containing protein [Mesobacterium sp. TK19101]
MTRTILFAATLTTAASLFALGANAQSTGTPQMTVAQIASMLAEQGYTVREIELERGRFDVEMIDAKGMKVEAYLDAATGEVLPYADDDDSEDDDDDRGGKGDRDRDGGRDDD